MKAQLSTIGRATLSVAYHRRWQYSSTDPRYISLESEQARFKHDAHACRADYVRALTQPRIRLVEN